MVYWYREFHIYPKVHLAHQRVPKPVPQLTALCTTLKLPTGVGVDDLPIATGNTLKVGYHQGLLILNGKYLLLFLPPLGPSCFSLLLTETSLSASRIQR